MQYQQFSERYIVRLASGEDAIETLITFLKQENIPFADLSAAGAVAGVQLGYWNAESRQYEYREFQEQLEVVSFQGNAALKEGSPFLHVHAAFARRDFSLLGGHVKAARVHPTLEVWLRTDDVAVRRSKDAATGLDLFDLANGDPRHKQPSLTAAPEGSAPHHVP